MCSYHSKTPAFHMRYRVSRWFSTAGGSGMFWSLKRSSSSWDKLLHDKDISIIYNKYEHFLVKKKKLQQYSSYHHFIFIPYVNKAYGATSVTPNSGWRYRVNSHRQNWKNKSPFMFKVAMLKTLMKSFWKSPMQAWIWLIWPNTCGEQTS